MKKKELVSMTIISMLLLSTLTVAYLLTKTPTALASPGTIRHSVAISPTTKTLDTLPKNVTYWVNVTSTGDDFINKTCIKLPQGWTNTTVSAPSGWTLNAFNDEWLNFTTANEDFKDNAKVNFSIPVTISMIPTEGTWKVYCYKATLASDTNPISVTVTVKLQFSSAMSPNYVRNGTSYIYTVTTTNDACSVGIKQINITFPAGAWSFNELVDYNPRTWTVSFDEGQSTFKLTGPNILTSESVMIKVNLTTPEDATAGEYYWNVSSWNANNQYLGNYSIRAVVDSSKPTIAFNAPASGIYYSAGFGKYVWINVTVNDTPDIEKYGITVAINDTARFQPHPTHPSEKVTINSYKYFFVNKTAIPDGKLTVKITATDLAGNVGTNERSTTIDNNAPALLWVKVMDVTAEAAELPYVSGVYWMGADTEQIQVNASFYNPASFTGTIYLNTTSGSFANETLWPTTPYDVTDANQVTLKITLVDGALPTKNNFTRTWEIKRDKVKPAAPTYTAQAICGGAIIKSLTATDNVGVLEYRIYINGTSSDVLVTELNSATMKWLVGVPTAGNSSIAFSGTIVLNLTIYAGKTVNVTICTIDFGANPSNPTTYYVAIPKGQWYPIELYENWNLVSLPLVPTNSSIQAVLSLLLKPERLESIWTYDAETVRWLVYSPGAPSSLTTMVDGKGYLVKMTSYDVLVVQGTQQPLPPATPRAYHIVPGWNLVGYKETFAEDLATYLSGIEYIRVYRFDASTQSYELVKSTDNMTPGLGYWVAATTEGWIYP